MALPVTQLAKQAFDLAKSLTPVAFKAGTIRMKPTQGAYDPATDASSTTWSHEITCDLLQYDDADERDQAAIDATMAVFLVSIQDLSAATASDPIQDLLNEDAEVAITGAETWEVYRAEFDPSQSVGMLYCRR